MPPPRSHGSENAIFRGKKGRDNGPCPLAYRFFFTMIIDSGLVGCRESRRFSRDTYPESYITKHTSLRRLRLGGRLLNLVASSRKSNHPSIGENVSFWKRFRSPQHVSRTFSCKTRPEYGIDCLLSLTPTPTHTLSLTHSHTHTHPHPLSLSLTHTHPPTHTLSLSHPPTHTHSLSRSLSHTHSLSLQGCGKA